MKNLKALFWMAIAITAIVLIYTGRAQYATETIVDPQTNLERLVSQYEKFFNAQTAAFEKASAAVANHNWQYIFSTFGPILALFVVGATCYIGLGWLEGLSLKARVLRGVEGDFVLGTDRSGAVVAVPIRASSADADGESPQDESPETYTFTETDQLGNVVRHEVREAKPRDGYSVDAIPGADPLEKIANFFERAIRVAGGNSRRVPTHQEMRVSGREWNAIVNDDRVRPLLKVKRGWQGGTEIRSDSYANLRAVYVAARRREL